MLLRAVPVRDNRLQSGMIGGTHIDDDILAHSARLAPTDAPWESAHSFLRDCGVSRTAGLPPTSAHSRDCQGASRTRPNAVHARNSCTDDAGRPLQYIPLPSRTGDPILRLRLDRPAPVGEVAPHFLPHGATYLLRQCCECLASGSPTAFKGAVIDIE